MYEDIVRVTIEVMSAIACFILVRFMIKPFQLTREVRYLGLPLGFAILGSSYVFVIVSPALYSNLVTVWLSHITRVFAFVFLATTYYFSSARSSAPAENTRILWDLTLSLLIVTFAFLSVIGGIRPEYSFASWGIAQMFLRAFTLIFLSYIIIHVMRTHVREPDPTTIWIPLGYILLAVSQYSLILCYLSPSIVAAWGGLVLRLAGLGVFLFVTYRAFYSSKRDIN